MSKSIQPTKEQRAEWEKEWQREYDEELEKRRVDFSKNPYTKYSEEELESFVNEYSLLYQKHKNDTVHSLISDEDYKSLNFLFDKLVNEEERFLLMYLNNWKSNLFYMNKGLFNSLYHYIKDDEICKFDRLTSLEDIVVTPVFENIDPRIVKYLVKFMKTVDEAKRGS